MTPIKVVYLARLREALGLDEERISMPQTSPTVADVLEVLRSRDKNWANELGEGRAVRAAINFTMATPDTMLNPNDELAFFPPVTGG